MGLLLGVMIIIIIIIFIIIVIIIIVRRNTNKDPVSNHTSFSEPFSLYFLLFWGEFRAEEEKSLQQRLGYLFLIQRRVGILVLSGGGFIRMTVIRDWFKEG